MATINLRSIELESFELRPHLPIEHPIIDRLIQMRRLNVLTVVEVGDGAADAEDFVVGAGGEAEVVDAVANQLLAFVGELAELANLPTGHLAVVARAAVRETLGLNGAGGDDELAHVRTRCPRSF